ncbi:MAG: hypothetical protein OXG88_03945 [Gammaproteobacteria bacterium]|nr:hypothetical protein [Gammaproteobacteria bacterium]
MNLTISWLRKHPFLLGTSSAFFVSFFVLYLFSITNFSDPDGTTVVLDPSTTKSSISSDTSFETIEELFSFFTKPSVSYDSVAEFLANESQEQLLAVVDRFVDLERDKNSIVFERLLVGELATRSPRDALATVWRFPQDSWNSLVSFVFGEWAVLDLEAAFDAAAKLNWSLRKLAVDAILAEREKLDESEILYKASTLNLSSFVSKRLAKTKALSLADHPKQAWASLINDGVNDRDQIDLLVQVAKDMYLEDGLGTLEEIYRAYSLDFSVMKELISAIAVQDPAQVSKIVLQTPVKSQEWLAAMVFGTWAEQDPEQALQATNSIRKSSIRRTSINSILTKWSESEPFAVLEQLDSLPDEFRQQAANNAIRNLAQIDIDIALEQLSLLPQKLGNVAEITEIALVEEWVKQDVIGAFEWIDNTTDKGSVKRSRMMQRLLRGYALVDPDKALQIALSESPDDGFWGNLEPFVIEALVRDDRLNRAAELLDKLPEESQLTGYVEVGQAMVLSNRSAEAIELASQLSDEKEVEYFRYLARTWVEFKPVELYNLLETYNSPPTRLAVAQEVLQLYEDGYAMLSKTQKDFLEKLIADNTN